MNLEQRLWDALVAMQLLSNGPTQRFDGDRITGSKTRALFPAGEAQPEYLAFYVRFSQAKAHKSRLEIVEEAEKALSEWRKAKPPSEPEWKSYWWKVMVANDDRPLKDQVKFYGVSRQTIQVYRRKFRTKDAA